MPDPLTPDDLEAILRGGGSAESKLQRAAAIALEKRAMGKDLLTEAELWALASPDVGSFRDKLQAAARLGAERERERAARACEAWAEQHRIDAKERPNENCDFRIAAIDCAAAIRRDEGGVMGDVCIWSEDGEDGPWATECGHYFQITADTPAKNGMAFCCFCGKSLVQLPHAEDDHETD